MDKGIYTLRDGKLIYQLKKNGIFYDADTNKPLMNKYQRAKEKARDKAVEWQSGFSDQNYSYGELAYWGEYFRGLAKRYGLMREFKENGII